MYNIKMSMNSMDTIVRYKSRQGGNFTTTLNKVDFDIPEGVYDFSKSHIEILTEYSAPTWTDALHTSQECVVPFVQRARGDSDRTFAPATYVRRARLQCDNQGHLEDIDRVDVLRNSLAVYEKDKAGMESLGYKSVSQSSMSNTEYSSFVDLRYQGTVKSTRKQERVIIKLSELLELGKESVVPMDRSHLGRGQLSLDLELANLATVRSPADITGVVGGLHAMATRVSLTATLPAATTIPINSILTVPFPARENWQDKYDQLYVGAAVTLTAGGTYAGALNNGGVFVITGITKGVAPAHYPNAGVAPENVILITFNAVINDTAVAATQTFLVNLNLTAPTGGVVPTYIEAQLVLHQINRPIGKIANLNYMTFSTELVATAGTAWQQQYVVEPNAVNIFIANCPNNTALPFSTAPTLNDYRLSLNGKPIMPRTIEITSAGHFNTLHYELLSQAFINGTMKLDSLLESTLDLQEADPADKTKPAYIDGDTRSILIGTPVPITNNMKLFQVLLNQDTAGKIGNLQLFKQIVRNIVF